MIFHFMLMTETCLPLPIKCTCGAQLFRYCF